MKALARAQRGIRVRTRQISRGPIWDRVAAAMLWLGHRGPLIIGIPVLLILLVEVVLAILHPAGALRHWGGDYTLYMDATRRWLGGGPFYQPWQLAGHYSVSFTPGDKGTEAIMYPPYSLLLFVPFTALPPALWWAIPILVTSWALARHRPRAWGLVAIGVCLTWPATLHLVANGNPVLWCVAFCAGATLWHWPGPLVILKPTLAPFALVGVRSRGWWVTLVVLLAACVPLAALWSDYVRVIGNLDGDNLIYGLGGVTMLAVPMLASAFARTRPGVGTWRLRDHRRA